MQTQYLMCQDGSNVWRTMYDTSGNPEFAEIVTYGRGGSDKPLIWVYFFPDKDRGFSHAILTLPGKPAEQITGDELVELNLCTLPEYL
jgi:hypothetical protein